MQPLSLQFVPPCWVEDKRDGITIKHPLYSFNPLADALLYGLEGILGVSLDRQFALQMWEPAGSQSDCQLQKP
jgi:hypothetical protein